MTEIVNEIFKAVKGRLMESAWLSSLHCFDSIISRVHPWTFLHCVHCIGLDLEVYVLSSIVSVK